MFDSNSSLHLPLNFPSQIAFNPQLLVLLVAVGSENGGQLNPAILDPANIAAVTIIVRSICCLPRTPTTPGPTQTILFDVVVEPADWAETPCSYLPDDCVVFENADSLMFAPDTPSGAGTVRIQAFD